MKSGDYLIVTLAAIMLIALYVNMWSAPQQAGDRVRIVAEGSEPIIAPLDRDHVYRIHGRLGDSVIEIHQGRIHFASSPCPGKQCIHAGWLERDGDFAACLPNGITVTVLGRNPRFDAINF
ncbi:MAG: NusG domain II-containing protein [Gammaproteobacteria bacterium]|nr:NusG domain II-containing protein [Gammaproteobacteria bacterium]